MLTLGLLTCQRLPNLSDSDQSLIPIFKEHGINAEAIIWNAPSIDWTRYDGLIIRNTWDYYTQSERFISWLKTIRDYRIPLSNSVDVVLGNMHKFYLRDFERNGVTVIPTLFSDRNSPISLQLLKDRQWANVVVKPAVSAGSYQTAIHSVTDLTEEGFNTLISENDWLIQPFVPEIKDGELSLIFFNGKYSHGVIKKPREGDFRVQKQYGGLYQSFDPDAELLQVADSIIQQIRQPLLFARVDGVMINDKFHLMELELIEPDLYLEFGTDIKKRFVACVVDHFARQSHA